MYYSACISLAYATQATSKFDSSNNRKQWFSLLDSPFGEVQLSYRHFRQRPERRAELTVCLYVHTVLCCYRCPGLNGNHFYLLIMCLWFRMQNTPHTKCLTIKTAFSPLLYTDRPEFWSLRSNQVFIVLKWSDNYCQLTWFVSDTIILMIYVPMKAMINMYDFIHHNQAHVGILHTLNWSGK